MPKKPTERFVYKNKNRRWWDNHNQRFISKREKDLLTLQSKHDEAGEFGFPVIWNRTPDSDLYAKVERLVGQGERGKTIDRRDPVLVEAANRFNSLVAMLDPDPDYRGGLVGQEPRKDERPPDPIPAAIRSAMNLSEYYNNTEGDVWQHLESAIDVAISPEITVSVPKDKGLEKQLQEHYSVHGIDMRHVLYQLMMCVGVWGSAYPIEIPQDKATGQAESIFMLPPRYIWVGNHLTYGQQARLPQNAATPYAIRPLNNSETWTQDLVQNAFRPMTYNAFGPDFNEQVLQGWGIPINPNYLYPVRAKAFDWQRYPLPPYARAFRSISTRAVYREMRRALLEGYKNQLWLFVLGTKDMPPSPKEMAALKAAIGGLNGQRTGDLVWRFGLEVKVIVPEGLEAAIGDQIDQSMTLAVYRDLGSNIRLATGNKLLSGSSGGDQGLDIDLTMYLRRLEFARTQVLKWEQGYRRRWAERDGSRAAEKIASAKVGFSKSLLEVGSQIEKELQPLYTIGLISPQTTLERSGYDYETELERKKEFDPNKEKFGPPASFSQTVAGPNGASKTVSQTKPQGRPKTSLKAADDEADRKAWFAEIYAALRELLWERGDPAAFIAALKMHNASFTRLIGRASYEASGGAFGTVNGAALDEWLDQSSAWINAFADGFLEDLNATDEHQTARIAWRAMLYPQEGYKMAVLNGQMFAFQQQGASHWRRVLHPEKSASGPCPLCVADSQIVHASTEPFIVMHPNEMCGAQALYLQYFVGAIPSIEMPVPSHRNEIAAMVEEGLKTPVNGRLRRRRL